MQAAPAPATDTETPDPRRAFPFFLLPARAEKRGTAPQSRAGKRKTPIARFYHKRKPTRALRFCAARRKACQVVSQKVAKL